MIPTVTTKLAIAAAGLLLAGTAVAAAVDAPPEAADKGLATAEEHTGFPVPVAAGAPAEDDELDDEAIEDDAEVGDDVEGDDLDGEDTEAEDEPGDESGGPVGNHGAAVSAVAKDHTLTGREHGKAVSEVARSDAGKPADDGDGDEPEPDERSAQGNGKGHGQP